MNYLKRRKLLQQHMEQLSEESKKSLPGHECDYAYAMVAVEKELSKVHPIFISVFVCIIVNFLFCFIKKLE